MKRHEVRRLLRSVMVWFVLGFALLLLALPGLAHTVALDAVGEAGFVWARAFTVLAGWIAFALVFGGLSFAARHTRFHARFFDRFSRTINGLAMLLILACALKIGFEVVPDYSQLALAVQLDRWLGPTWAVMGALVGGVGVPGSLGAVPTAPLLFGALLVFGRMGVNWGARESVPRAESAVVLNRGVRRVEYDAAVEARRKAVGRKVAVAAYADAKSLLAEAEMDLTFLSLDIVGSTTMKHDEDPYIVEKSFADYRALVERALRRHGAYKQTWTPDGQMAAFQDAQAAIDCARDILLALPEFNEKVSNLRTPFRLRAGANCGTVSTDDETPMERMSDFSIDVAGHMQKFADTDSVWLSRDVYEQLADTTGIEPKEQEVDGRQVFVWRRPD